MLHLTAEEIISITTGAVRFEKNDAGELSPRRFHPVQEEIYSEASRQRARCASGMRLEFLTDATRLTVAYRARGMTSRRFCFFDVALDGVLIAHEGHDGVLEVTSDFSVDLGEGVHRVTVYLPNLFEVFLRDVALAGGTMFMPVERGLRLLALGDSITQGYDATFPSMSYANALADRLNAEMLNLGIGGETFYPDMADADASFAPDIVTVAYGTNDWCLVTRRVMEENAREYCRRLRAAYPAADVFLITPVWRADEEGYVSAVGTLDEAREIAAGAARENGITVIDGAPFLPHVREIFSDGYLHPNDLGFKSYADALYAALVPHLTNKEG